MVQVRSRVWGLHDRITVLIRSDTMDSMLSLSLPWDDTVRGGRLAARNQTMLTRTRPCWLPDLGLPASRIVGRYISVA